MINLRHGEGDRERSRRDYAALLGRLYAARRFGMRLGLERMVGVLDQLGRPQDRLPLVIQVAGTNGKGSTAAFTESILRHAGLVTGLYTSPHLSRLAERFRVGGAELAPAELLHADAEVTRAAARARLDLTFFEQLTAMAVVAFAERGVEVAVLEVGMGGRFDATTAVGARIAGVTGVALDHCQYLGDTVEDIAREKAGVFAPGQRGVVGASGEPEARAVLVAEARARGVDSLIVIDDGDVAQVTGPLGLPGPHQRANAACALALVDAVARHRGQAMDGEVRRRGLASCQLPGRFELVATAPDVLVDGAHNPQAARALARAMDERRPERDWVVVLGVSSDKDAGGIAAPLALRARHLVATASRNPRALSPEALAARVAEGGAARVPTSTAPDLAAALAEARAVAGPTGHILVAGSLFIVGEAREVLCGEPADPQPLWDPIT